MTGTLAIPKVVHGPWAPFGKLHGDADFSRDLASRATEYGGEKRLMKIDED